MRDQTIIRKKKKVVAGEQSHGGAWKVAYADFVTALMAFFLLMWIIATVGDDKRRGLAEYFEVGIPVSDLSGGAKTVVEAGRAGSEQRREHTASPLEAAEYARIAASLAGGDSIEADLIRRHVASRLTDEGMVISLSALPNAPLFTSDHRLMPLARVLLWVVVREISAGDARLALSSHLPLSAAARSADPLWRANLLRVEVLRQEMLTMGIAAERIYRVEGQVEQGEFASERLEITLLRAGM